MSPSKQIWALHGAGMQAGVWGAFAEALPCRALSLPGHGDTPGPLLLSIEAMAAWVETQMQGAPAGSIILAGHSMGSLVALEAARHPAVAALVLIGAAARMPVHPDLLQQAKDAPAAAAGLVVKWSIPKTNADAASYVQEYMQPSALFNDLSACNDYRGTAMTEKPALVIIGADDKMTKAEDGAALAAQLPRAKVCTLSATGHMAMAEKPAEAAQAIMAFVAGFGG